MLPKRSKKAIAFTRFSSAQSVLSVLVATGKGNAAIKRAEKERDNAFQAYKVEKQAEAVKEERATRAHAAKWLAR